MVRKKLNIGILFGGMSCEHEVSIKSAINIVNSLKSHKNLSLYEITYIYIDKKGKWWNSIKGYEFLKKGVLNVKNEEYDQKENFNLLFNQINNVDIFFPILHGPNGEDGSVQGLFKLLNKPYVGSNVLSSALGMDKLAMKLVFKEANLSQVLFEKVESRQIKDPNSLDEIISKIEVNIGYPCFVKPANLGSSIGISKVTNRNSLIDGLKLASDFDDRLIIEEGVKGRELECGVIEDEELKASVVGEVKFESDWYDYETKYSSTNSMVAIPADIPPTISNEIQRQSIEACKAISIKGLARVDFFYVEKTNSIYINEINTMPGFTSKSMFPKLWEKSGISFEDLVSKLVQTAKI